MTIRKRPRKLSVKPFDTYRKSIPDALRMHQFLTDTRARSYLRVYFLRGKDLMMTEVKDALKNESRCRIAELHEPELLRAAVSWLHAHGGLTIYTTLHGKLEKLN